MSIYNDCVGIISEYIDFDLFPSDNVENRVGFEHISNNSSMVETNKIYYWKSGESSRLL